MDQSRFLNRLFFLQARQVETPLVYQGVTDVATRATEPFQIRGEPTAVELKLSGASYPLQIGLEELGGKSKFNLEIRSPSQRLFLSRVPEGIYLLRASETNLHIAVFAGAKSASNFILAGLLMCLPTLIIFAIDQILICGDGERNESEPKETWQKSGESPKALR